MITGERFFFTRHAVDRYMTRVAPALDARDALYALRDLAGKAIPLEKRTPFGQKVWLVQDPPMRFITKHDFNGPVVVTIVEGTDGGEREAIEEVEAAHRRLQSVQEAGVDVRAEEHVAIPEPQVRNLDAWAKAECERLKTERARLSAINGAISLIEHEAKRAHKTERHRINEDNNKARYSALIRELSDALRMVTHGEHGELLARAGVVLGRNEHTGEQQ